MGNIVDNLPETGPPPAPAVPAEPGETVGAPALATCAVVPAGTASVAPGAIEAERLRELTPKEEAFARAWVLYRSGVRAYREAYQPDTMKPTTIRTRASEVLHRPWVQRRIGEFEAQAAAAVAIDYAALLMDDLRIIQGAQFADELSRFVWQACRYCHGIGHKYHWVDDNEYWQAVAKATDDNAERSRKKQREQPLPSDEGGYGFDRNVKPHPDCPVCGGLGEQRAVMADTDTLEGPARALFKGVRVTQSGVEILTHDVDKAKERVMRAGGMFGDDAASVARGAAAGAAAGAAIARRAGEIDEDMSSEQAARIYLELSQ